MPSRFLSALQGAEQRLISDAKSRGQMLDHAGEKGRGREHLLLRELRALLPGGFAVTTGFTSGLESDISTQRDPLGLLRWTRVDGAHPRDEYLEGAPPAARPLRSGPREELSDGLLDHRGDGVPASGRMLL